MTVRAANFEDIKQVEALMRDAYERSIYFEKATYDEIAAKQLCVQMVQRHGHGNYGGTLFMVSETDGKVLGFFMGVFVEPYPGLKELRATDVLFYFTYGARPRDAAEMVLRARAWAESNPKCIELFLGLNNAIGDWTRTAKLYERLGLEQCGGMFRLEIDHVGNR